MVSLAGAMLVLVLLLFPATAGAKQHARHLPFRQWVAFDAGVAGPFDAQGLFKFASGSPVILRVTDGFCRGDRYRVLDHGQPVLTTSAVPVDMTCTQQPFATTGPEGWSDQGYSRGQIRLAPGRHRIRIRSLVSPFGGSTGWLEALRVDD